MRGMCGFRWIPLPQRAIRDYKQASSDSQHSSRPTLLACFYLPGPLGYIRAYLACRFADSGCKIQARPGLDITTFRYKFQFL